MEKELECESININRNQFAARFIQEDKNIKAEPGKIAVKTLVTIQTPIGEKPAFEVGKVYSIKISEKKDK